MAFRGQKEYQLALKDLEEAKKLMPNEKDIDKYITLTKEDLE